MNEEEVMTKADKRLKDFIHDKEVCEEIAARIWRVMVFPPNYVKLPCVGHCFQIVLPKNEMVKAVSCSIPFDTNRNISERMHSFDCSITYETALIGHDDDLIYIDALGYNDIRKFEFSREVVEEVMRVMDEINKMIKNE